MSHDNLQAKQYIESIDLSGVPRGLLPQGAATDAREVFDEAKTQARVVGSGLFAFATGVTAPTREAISDSALLAQLVANKRASLDESPTAWFATYLGVLQNIGWVLQDHGWVDYTANGTAAEVHEQVMEILKGALGPSTAALTIVQSAVEMLRGMKPSNSWISLFRRESQHAQMARFQVGLVETGAAADVFVSLLGCVIKGTGDLTQVLVFRFRSERASFIANNATATINRASLDELEPTIRAKTLAYQADYLSSIKDI